MAGAKDARREALRSMKGRAGVLTDPALGLLRGW